ncbi:MAG: hypothetical protein ACXV3V_08510 [Actinomycetes bacterium]
MQLGRDPDEPVTLPGVMNRALGYSCFTQLTAASASRPPRTTRAASAAPVRLRPLLQAISTSSPQAARSCASERAATAAGESRGIPSGGQSSHAERQVPVQSRATRRRERRLHR